MLERVGRDVDHFRHFSLGEATLEAERRRGIRTGRSAVRKGVDAAIVSSPGAHLDDVVRLYEFDRKLRTLIHDGIERVEVALRSHVSYLVGAIGPLGYRDASLFRPSFNHREWLATARLRANRARRHSEPIQHHEAKYDGELPIWVLTEVLDFSGLSKLYDGLATKDQWAIAERLGVVIDDSALGSNQRSKACCVLFPRNDVDIEGGLSRR